MSPDSSHAVAAAAIERDLEAGRFAAARVAATELLAGAPGDAGLLCLAGRTAYVSGDPVEAERLLLDALRADRRHAHANHVLGNLYHDQGKSDRAISCYRRAIRADPLLIAAHNDLGTAYFAKGWYREAEEVFRETVSRMPDSAEAQQNLGEALRRQGKLAEARRSLQRALRLRVKSAIKRLFSRLR